MTIRNIPDDVHRAFRIRAAMHDAAWKQKFALSSNML
ncbi:FitA-like ribbon-helix-helix domain-containing protein [Desulfovibrio inopinatus]